MRLAPFADWSAPTARVINGQLIWLLDGYLASGTFPLTGRVTWRDHRVGSVRAAFLGTVNAETGATRVFLQPGADALAETWAALSQGVVEPGSTIPEGRAFGPHRIPPSCFGSRRRSWSTRPGMPAAWKEGADALPRSLHRLRSDGARTHLDRSWSRPSRRPASGVSVRCW